MLLIAYWCWLALWRGRETPAIFIVVDDVMKHTRWDIPLTVGRDGVSERLIVCRNWRNHRVVAIQDRDRYVHPGWVNESSSAWGSYIPLKYRPREKRPLTGIRPRRGSAPFPPQPTTPK